MALKKDTPSERLGGTFPDAYIRLAYVRWSDVDMKVIATFSVWASPTAREDGKEALGNIDVDVTDEFPDVQARTYTKAKFDPQLLDAIDV